jgi:hypothetical protein
MIGNLDSFVLEPSPQGVVVKCRVTRERKGMDGGESFLHGLFIHLSYCLSFVGEIVNKSDGAKQRKFKPID